MSIIYLDASVALRAILNVPERKRLQHWMDAPGIQLVSSRLIRTELVRVLRREGQPLSAAAPLLSRIGLIDILRETHSVAESIERHIRTLDALHLATALLIGDAVVVATHDNSMKSVAQSLGLQVTDPIIEL